MSRVDEPFLVISGDALTDIDLGGPTDGFGVARCFRTVFPDIPVVFISGAAGIRYRTEAVKPSSFLAKPFVMHELTDALDRVLH